MIARDKRDRERARPGDGVVGCGCVRGCLVGWSVLVCAFVCAFGLRSCVRFVVCSRVSCPGLRFIEAPSRPGPAGAIPAPPVRSHAFVALKNKKADAPGAYLSMACIPDVQELSKSWTGCPRGPWRERAAEELRPPSPVVLINVGCVPI